MNNKNKYSKILLTTGVILFLIFLIIRGFTDKYNNTEYKNIEISEETSNLEDDDFKDLLKIIIEEKDLELDHNSVLIIKDGDQNEDKYKEVKKTLRDKDYKTKVFIADIDELYKLYSDQNTLVKRYLDKIKFKDGDLLLYDRKGSPIKINGNTMISNKIKSIGDIETKELIYVKTNIIKNNINISNIISELDK